MKSKKRKILREVLDLCKIFFTAYMIAFAVNHTLIVNADVPTGSMEPTIEAGSRLIANRLAYLGESAPERGDVIIFYPPDGGEVPQWKRLLDMSIEKYVKRVIGLPGETIEGKGGQVYIDGDLLPEKYITMALPWDFGPYTIPDECYFVMGDNRANSFDSRYWENKFVPESAIIGKMAFEYLPKWKSIH